MFRLFRKNLLFLPFCGSSSSLQVRKLFIRFQACQFSSPSSSPPSQADSRKVPVKVWWDVDKCGVPSGVSYRKVVPSIMAAVRANGIKGNIDVTAYGDYLEIEDHDFAELHSTGYITTCSSFSRGGKNAAYEDILKNLEDWVYWNPPPAHLFFIFGDVHFSGILHRLRMCNYNILLACPEKAHVALCHAATIMWQWSSMLKGEDLIGKHFNYPPDYPFNSWYGNSNVPLENSFLAIQQPTSSQNAQFHRPFLDINVGETSKSDYRQVMKILSSHPNGMSIGDLRAKLAKSDPPLVKRFYGYKKFSNFLVSISHVQLEYLGKGNFWVRLVPSTTCTIKSKQKNNTVKNTSTCNDYLLLKNNDIANCESGKAVNKLESPTRKEVDEVCHSPFTSTLFSWIGSKWKFWKSNTSDWVEGKSPKEWQQDVSHWENSRVLVWWDFDTCGVPSGISFFNVAPSIMGVLRANRINGPIHIDAYGDVSQLSQIKQEALYLSGIDLHHNPGGKNFSRKWLMDWASRNPPPAHLFLIYDNREYNFSLTISLLRNCGYYILLARPRRRPITTYNQATIVWHWSSMLKGKYFTGRYYQVPPHLYLKRQLPIVYPPEWYSNSKVPLENPFLVAEEPTSAQNKEILELSSHINLVEVPKSLSRKIKKILSLYPNGIFIGHLSVELKYSCKLSEFVNILVSIPHVQLLYIGDDDFCVRLIPSTISTVKNEQRIVDHSRMPELFSIDSFWDDVESFVFTSRGSRLLSRSRSRVDVAHKFQKYGPTFLMPFTRNDILQLVELLIVEKKWLEENPSQEFPFRLCLFIRAH